MFDNRLAASPSLSPSAFSDQDEMSTLIHQILLRSSNQSTNLLDSQNPTSNLQQLPDVHTGEIEDYDFHSEVGRFTLRVWNASIHHIHHHSTQKLWLEGLEAMVEEATKRRRSSKRRRAAEVHNISEKRRRSKINEKMKALQDLIPNSNKTDKASMLDEAIEYLKQLQLQVQMLTLRNGLMLNPICVPIPPPLPTLSISNGSPVPHSLVPSSVTEFLKLHQSSSSNISLNSTQKPR